MKKALIHVGYILVILTLLVYAQIQAAEAEKQREVGSELIKKTEKNEFLAIQEAARATEQEGIAMDALKKAEEAQLKAELIMKDCLKK